MAEDKKDGLTEEELQQQSGEPLPDREAMSVVWVEPDPMPPVPPEELASEEGSPQSGDNEPLRGGEPS